MKLDFTPVYVAFGLSLATYLVLKLKKVKPDVKFNDVRFNKLRNEIELVVENISDKTLYVKPSLRLVRLTPASEWRERTSNGNTPVPMMTASAGSVIKGYELIGEYAEAVPVEAKTTMVIKYPVMRDFGLRAYDNIKVDSEVGKTPEKLDGSVTGTVQMNLSDLLSEDFCDELLDVLDDYLGASETQEAACDLTVSGAQDLVLDGGVEEHPVVKDDSDGGIFFDFRKSDFPVQAMCYCCGKDKWLNWVVDGNHVCDDCKDFLSEGDKPSGATFTEASQSSSSNVTDLKDDMLFSGEFEPSEYGVGMLDSNTIELKPRHRRILDILYEENTLSAKELAKRLERNEKPVSTDLRFLLKNNLVDRVKIGGKYKYFSLRDEEQVIIYDPGEESDNPTWT
ncbi:MAG: hypothetical protein GF416_01645 [Candidatus Altiarchaeales archaeon]|nr:hypothetical protein [Candidatus Altiarchaeales archaeon]MBD3415819.1 hypothetical protein [Candidatus Altiarchaeales archaeon]